MKSKGLQRLRWYCQVCQKQCRDDNGFKCHIQSEAHLRQMLVVGENAGRHIADFSGQFQHDFVQLLSRRFGTKRVKANTVYQEFIQDKHHQHMNSTRWVTLTEFVKHLGRTGVARVDETEKGWFIAWIDNSPKALEKQAAALQKERLTMSDEQRERLLITEQIERAKAEEEQGPSGSGSSESPPPVEEGLKREEGAEKVVLSFSTKPVAATTTRSAGLKLNANPLKAGMNALKQPNVFKTPASTPTSSTSTSIGAKRPALPPQSAAERVMFEDQERKRRKMEREAT